MKFNKLLKQSFFNKKEIENLEKEDIEDISIQVLYQLKELSIFENSETKKFRAIGLALSILVILTFIAIYIALKRADYSGYFIPVFIIADLVLLSKYGALKEQLKTLRHNILYLEYEHELISGKLKNE